MYTGKVLSLNNDYDQATVCTRSVRPGARAAERASTEACQEFHPDIG